MADYQPDDIVDMIMVLAESHNNYRAAARLYAERFPDRRHQDHRTISTLTERARGGHMVRHRRRHEYDENDARVLTVLAIVHLDPHISSRRVEREIGIPRRIFLRILKVYKYHAYHLTLVQELQFHHFQQRIVPAPEGSREEEEGRRNRSSGRSEWGERSRPGGGDRPLRGDRSCTTSSGPWGL